MPVPDFAQGIQTSFLASATHARLQAKADALAAANPSKPADSAKPATEASKDDDGYTFDDLLDVVNPLQHFPIVSTLYRHYAHDEIKPLPKIAGDALYGGLPGLVSSLADFAFEKITGKNFGDTVLAMITGDDDKSTALAANTPASAAKPNATAAATLASSVKPNVVAAKTSDLHAPRPLIVASASPPAQSATSSAATPPATGAAIPPATASSNTIPTLTEAQLNALMASINQKGIDPELSSRAMDAYRRMNDPATAATVQQLH